MVSANSLSGRLEDPARDAGYVDPPPRKGFFTDTSVCIGCKACEVACKEWNAVPEDGIDLLGMSYDNTGGLGADSWRAVAFIEQSRPVGNQTAPFASAATGHSAEQLQQDTVAAGIDVFDEASRLGTGVPGGQPLADVAADATGGCGSGGGCGCGTQASATTRASGTAEQGEQFLGMPGMLAPAALPDRDGRQSMRWLMMSNVCKHCTHAACLDVCPTGSLFRTEFGTVVVQEDICNGCGYCVSACPYGVIDKREVDGRAWKCTLCYDRLGEGDTPACAKACPTESIQYGDLDELRERAENRRQQLHDVGVTEARLYGHDPDDGVGGDGAFFLLLDEPEVYGLPPDPVVTTRDLPSMYKHMAVAAGAMVLGVVAAAVGRR
ncbi:4Fe-4S dicluster domain-containing protein [Paenibacillus sp. TRM 82003]|uniref:4Fe-4S dicluster domain-containing protein n=1 Tax=Kineococcus sp. TRM81007 TaxID=2925831 RepID=UPI001F57986A|nr:4Fe-4S dicluster domain-containing protein [Kineococcus sp. TRM81007]MCI2240649.1 4Fe-4S dicluster domain-containing protein [Kineococcus sp. TRM81007]MCI3925428.1 4Fe-4S dicluster domain-containing protein [Paenibacillus sp. TRM 82003]